MMKFIWLVPVALCGQTLQVQSEPTSAGHSGTFMVRLDSAPGKEPVALQWELEFAGTVLHMDFQNLVIGEAAKTAGKSIACSLVAREKRDRLRYRCVLAGGVRAIQNGPIAIVTYSTEREAKPGRYQLKLMNGLTVGPNLSKDRLKDSGGELTITITK
jgi:hypothetical protein